MRLKECARKETSSAKPQPLTRQGTVRPEHRPRPSTNSRFTASITVVISKRHHVGKKGEIMERGKATYSTIDEYIALFPKEIRKILTGLRKTIRAAAPDAAERISYQMPTYWQNGNLVHFAAYKNHIGFYPTPSGIQAFKKELSDYEGSKGAIRFPIDKPLPLDLIRNIAEYRVLENAKKDKSVSKKKRYRQ
jgi:uncharacterized protein YdhG (YjbR/CyaY superfamily)